MTDVELYTKAKEAYYSGEPIMSDVEFDELESRIGLENKGYIGSKYNPSYTIEHPFIMGSLSKVQVKYNRNGRVNWKEYFEEARNYFGRNKSVLTHDYNTLCIITPKYDGCSFEAVCRYNNLEKCLDIMTVSTRGDGKYGKDIRNHIIDKLQPLTKCFYKVFWNEDGYEHEIVLRGEVLVNKFIFNDKYADEFVNPRSFVAGVLNSDYTEELKSKCDDLRIVIYDTRVKTIAPSNPDYRFIDIDWSDSQIDIPYDLHPGFFKIENIYNEHDFEMLYHAFSTYRETCQYALDGFVIKPIDCVRDRYNTKERPDDCVAIKFTPMLAETEVNDIEWSLAKTGEMKPVIITNPVKMDGKTITRASAHNYGYLIDNKLSIGCKVTLSLAGDIIPYIYGIDSTNYDYTKLNISINEGYNVDGCHLYKDLNDAEIREQKFIESADSLSIPGIGPAAAKAIYDYMVEKCKGDVFLGEEPTDTPNNILLCTGVDICNALQGKTGINAQKSFNHFLENITLQDIIISCNFESCGHTISEQIVNKWLGHPYSFEHFAEKAYSWALDEHSSNRNEVNSILFAIGRSIESFSSDDKTGTMGLKQIPIIMTGEPTTCRTKAEFLKLHPEYCNTTSWKEVKIVFTGDINSNTSKMQKAREKGIEIKLY